MWDMRCDQNAVIFRQKIFFSVNCEDATAFFCLHLISQAVDVADCSFNFVYIPKPQYRKRNGLSMVLKMRQFLKYIVDWNVIVGRK